MHSAHASPAPLPGPFRQALRHWLWDSYDALGRLVAINVAISLVALPLAYNGLAAWGWLTSDLSAAVRVLTLCAGIAVFIAIFGTCWMSGVLHFAHLNSADRDPSAREAWRGIRAIGPRIFPLVATHGLVTGLAVLNAWFYALGGVILPPLAGYAAAGFVLGLWACWAGVVIHALPEMAGGGLLVRSLRVAFARAVRHGTATCGVLLALALLWGVSIRFNFAGVLILAFALTGTLINALHDVIAEREAASGADPAPAATWRERQSVEAATEAALARRRKYDRTFRDIMRPWDMD